MRIRLLPWNIPESLRPWETEFTLPPSMPNEDVSTWTKEDWQRYNLIFGLSAGFPLCCVLTYGKDTIKSKGRYGNARDS